MCQRRAMWRMELATNTNTDESSMGSQRACRTVMGVSYKFTLKRGGAQNLPTFRKSSTGWATRMWGEFARPAACRAYARKAQTRINTGVGPHGVPPSPNARMMRVSCARPCRLQVGQTAPVLCANHDLPCGLNVDRMQNPDEGPGAQGIRPLCIRRRAGAAVAAGRD